MGGCPGGKTHRWALALAPLAVPGVLDSPRAVLLGPGIGLDRGSARTACADETCLAGLQDFPGPCCARMPMALNARLASAGDGGHHLVCSSARGPTWLTPMAGECCPDSFPICAGRPRSEAAAAAAGWGGGGCQVSVLLKGASQRGASADGALQLLAAAAAVPAPDWETCWPGLCGRRGAAAGCGERGPLAAAALEHRPRPAWRAARTGRGAANAPANAQQSWPDVLAGWLSGGQQA